MNLLLKTWANPNFVGRYEITWSMLRCETAEKDLCAFGKQSNWGEQFRTFSWVITQSLIMRLKKIPWEMSMTNQYQQPLSIITNLSKLSQGKSLTLTKTWVMTSNRSLFKSLGNIKRLSLGITQIWKGLTLNYVCTTSTLKKMQNPFDSHDVD